jgi:hypothetical protein
VGYIVRVEVFDRYSLWRTSVRLPRRAAALAFTVLAATAALPADAAAAAGSGAGGAADTSVRLTCPSFAGEVLTRPDYPWYIVDKDGYLRGIPPGVNGRLFADDLRPRTDVPLELCGLGEDLGSDAVVLTASDALRPWFLYNKGKKYGISPGMNVRYHFDRSKLQLIPAVVLDEIPDGGPWA